jgi:hypothetical protein
MYPAEVNSHHMRNLGSAIAMVTNWLGVYVIVSVTPVGTLQTIPRYVYFL